MGRAANQLDRDLQAVREGADTESILGAIPFVTCPRCDAAAGSANPCPGALCRLPAARPSPLADQLGGFDRAARWPARGNPRSGVPARRRA